jgi:hypothetical protein
MAARPKGSFFRRYQVTRQEPGLGALVEVFFAPLDPRRHDVQHQAVSASVAGAKLAVGVIVLLRTQSPYTYGL